jgi:hypothetical protein
MAVGRRVGVDLGAEAAARARAVLDRERLAKPL